MWQKAKEKILGVLGTVFILFWLFLGMKGCTFSVIDFMEDGKYQAHDPSTQNSSTIYLTNDEKLILKKRHGSYFVQAVFFLKGASATHYFGPFYNTGDSIFSIRYYPDTIALWDIEMTLAEKQGNVSSSTFDSIGASYRQLLHIRDGEIEIGDKVYRQVSLSGDDKAFLRSLKDHK